MDGPLPPDDGFERQEEPHSKGSRIVVNEVTDEESDNYLRERIGGVEDHGEGEHVNLNINLKNEETGETLPLDDLDEHIDL